MNIIGLVWFDDDPRHTLRDKVQAAAAHYRARFGATPTRGYVAAGALEQTADVAGVRLESAPALAANLLWLGSE